MSKTRHGAYRAQVWAREQRFDGDVAAKIIVMLLADYADEWATCYPGVDRIADETEVSRSTVLRKLKALAEAGLVTVERRANDRGHRTSNRYILELDVTVTAEQWRAARERCERRAEHPEEVQGVNVTPGSPEPPKSHAEHEPYVSSGDTGTTRGTTSSPLTPPTAAQEAAGALFEAPAVPEQPQPVNGRQSASTAFASFWDVYPRKTGKISAQRAFERALRHAPAEDILAGLTRAAAHWTTHRTETRFIPHPATWLNAGRWDDDLPAVEQRDENPYAYLPHPSQIHDWAVTG